MAQELEFFLQNEDWGTGGGGQDPQAGRLQAMTKRGWTPAAIDLHHPYVAVLWARPVGEPPEQAVSDLGEKLTAVAQERDDARRELAESRKQAEERRVQMQDQLAQVIQQRDTFQRQLAEANQGHQLLRDELAQLRSAQPEQQG